MALSYSVGEDDGFHPLELFGSSAIVLQHLYMQYFLLVVWFDQDCRYVDYRID